LVAATNREKMLSTNKIEQAFKILDMVKNFLNKNKSLNNCLFFEG